MEDLNMPVPETEYRFHDKRMWRFDYAWKDLKIAMEVQGGTFQPGGGKHNIGAGMRKDYEKYNEAVIDGWRILFVFPEDLCKRSTILLLRRALIF